MARTARMLCNGGMYHILNRGHNNQTLFHASKDYLIFKKYVRSYLSVYKIVIHHYAIMPNHFHLLLKLINTDDLPKFMKGVCQTYAQYHHRRHKTVGYLFQNRYKSILIKDNQYLTVCARYIERNPLRAGLVDCVSDYPYSSYRYYAKGVRDSIITENPTYCETGKTVMKRQKRYVEDVNAISPYEEIVDKKLQISR